MFGETLLRHSAPRREHPARSDFGCAPGHRRRCRRLRLHRRTGQRQQAAAGSVDRQPRVSRQPDACAGAHRRLAGLLPGCDAQGHHGQDDHVQHGHRSRARRSSVARSTPRSSAPDPAISAFLKTKGKVRHRRWCRLGRSRPRRQLEDRRRQLPGGPRRPDPVASPSLGNTQDISLRTWLASPRG